MQAAFPAPRQLAMRHDVNHQHPSVLGLQRPADFISEIPALTGIRPVHIIEATECCGDLPGMHGGLFQQSQPTQLRRAVTMLLVFPSFAVSEGFGLPG